MIPTQIATLLLLRHRPPYAAGPISAGGYRLYGPAASPDAIDFAALAIAFVAAGVSSMVIDHADDTDCWYACRSVSSAGIESTESVFVRVRVASGVLSGPAPNPVSSNPGPWAEARAAGRVRVHLVYTSRGEAAMGTAIEIARVITGAADFATSLATIKIPGSVRLSYDLPTVFDNNEIVRLAIRVTAASGAASRAVNVLPVVADSSAPQPPAYVTATQYGGAS